MTQDNVQFIIKLKPTIFATKRTRERIKQEGPYFLDITPRSTTLAHPKPGSTLFQSLKTDWWGWLPDGEYRITHKQRK